MIQFNDIHKQPFFHILANMIGTEIGDSDPQAVIATTMAAFALSSILTGTDIGHIEAFPSETTQVLLSSPWVSLISAF